MKPKRKRRLSRRQEEEIMAGLEGGRTQPGSGSVSGYKSDGRVLLKLRMEAKYTTAQTFKLERKDLDKIRGECVWGETPVMVVDFKEPKTGRTEDRWAVVPHHIWEELVNAATADDD